MTIRSLGRRTDTIFSKFSGSVIDRGSYTLIKTPSNPGDLGIFFEGEVARYQNVETHPEYRRRGICGTLVYGAGQAMLTEFPVKHLVMEADPEYHAARIYESVGFKRNEINHALSWWKSKGELKAD